MRETKPAIRIRNDRFSLGTNFDILDRVALFIAAVSVKYFIRRTCMQAAVPSERSTLYRLYRDGKVTVCCTANELQGLLVSCSAIPTSKQG